MLKLQCSVERFIEPLFQSRKKSSATNDNGRLRTMTAYGVFIGSVLKMLFASHLVVELILLLVLFDSAERDLIFHSDKICAFDYTTHLTSVSSQFIQFN